MVPEIEMKKKRFLLNFFYCYRMLPVWFSFLAVWWANSLLVNSVSGQEAWYAPGCHKVGKLHHIL